MRKSMDIGSAVGPFLVANRHFQNLEIELGRPEQQVEIAEGIEISEIRPAGRDAFVVSPEQYFRSTERILNSFAE